MPAEFCGEFLPPIPAYDFIHMLDSVTFMATVRVTRGTNGRTPNPESLQVQLWTEHLDKDHDTPGEKAIDLEYRGLASDGCCHEFAYTAVITSSADFDFKFRINLNRRVPLPDDSKEWIWSHKGGETGHVVVKDAPPDDSWTQEVTLYNVFRSVHIGNATAAKQAQQLGITHVLNVADDVCLDYSETISNKSGPKQLPIILNDRIRLMAGAGNSIDDLELAAAVSWLQAVDNPKYKVLVCSRAGVGRAACVVVAFVYAETWWTFDYVLEYVRKATGGFVYLHADTKNSIVDLYPRPVVGRMWGQCTIL